MPPAVASPPLTVTFLGTGTSTGVPMIGCQCPVCTSSDPRNKRFRVSILVTAAVPGQAPANLLVDTTPEMRLQMLRAGVRRVDSVLITHTHADHIFGMDDIRQFNFIHNVVMPVYGSSGTLDHLRRVFDYVFKETQAGGGKPQLDLRSAEALRPLPMPGGVDVTPLPVLHGQLPIFAYKFGKRFAYLTDVSRIPEETLPYLRGLDTLVLGAVRFDPHPTHFGLYQALDVIADLAPRRAYLTHLSHYFDYAKVNATLPANVRLAYDGLTLKIPAADGDGTQP